MKTFEFLQMYLDGVKVTTIAKRQKVSDNYVYVKIAKEITAINEMLNMNLGLKCADISANKADYFNALKQIEENYQRNRTTEQNKSVTVKISPVDLLLESLQPEYRKGAVIMYNYLKSTYERK